MRHPQSLDVVALLQPLALEALQLADERYNLSVGLATGTVGTVVEVFPQHAESLVCLVEFSDSQGRGYAFATVPAQALLVLHYTPSEPVAVQP
ncbi:MAG: DUF4926 domain-containing protein [Candidatus Binatia bacterium]